MFPGICGQTVISKTGILVFAIWRPRGEITILEALHLLRAIANNPVENLSRKRCQFSRGDCSQSLPEPPPADGEPHRPFRPVACSFVFIPGHELFFNAPPPAKLRSSWWADRSCCRPSPTAIGMPFCGSWRSARTLTKTRIGCVVRLVLVRLLLFGIGGVLSWQCDSPSLLTQGCCVFRR